MLVLPDTPDCGFVEAGADEHDAGCGEGRHLEKEGLPGKLEFYISFGSRDVEDMQHMGGNPHRPMIVLASNGLYKPLP